MKKIIFKILDYLSILAIFCFFCWKSKVGLGDFELWAFFALVAITRSTYAASIATKIREINKNSNDNPCKRNCREVFNISEEKQIIETLSKTIEQLEKELNKAKEDNDYIDKMWKLCSKEHEHKNKLILDAYNARDNAKAEIERLKEINFPKDIQQAYIGRIDSIPCPKCDGDGCVYCYNVGRVTAQLIKEKLKI